MMKRKKILTIKDWHGTGKGDLHLEVLDYTIERLSYATEVFDRLTVRRKPDQYSSRIGMMAYLNKSKGRLSLGFAGMTLQVAEISENGTVLAHRKFSFLGGAVGSSSTDGNLETISLISPISGADCAGNH